ncbi:hypothetical protein HK099_004473 [Clydaea vesicula]|uniref:DUF952 domain-containing protein n=1 Tax=Clydaea vesicula TaxID=447962 RepID=A0AAD5U0M4_9FUNG|nr:hypothetical protein HK099_004473 [Clydaea vesicula]KAJ3384785.1 hypothetical protein HDU92_003424 [Lobulomyces angularis]
METVYKVLTPEEFKNFEAEAVGYAGNQMDKKDGFIHLSLHTQVAGVLSRFYKTNLKVYVLKFEINKEKLKFEKPCHFSDETFPHIYHNQLLKSELIEVINLQRTNLEKDFSF